MLNNEKIGKSKHKNLMNLIIMEVLIILIITSYQYFFTKKFPLLKHVSGENVYQILFIISIILCILIFLTLICLLNRIKIKDSESMENENRLKDSQEMVQALRANQHDFINHLQVICGAAQLGKLDVIEEYSKDLFKQVKEINVISNISYPEIAALLYTKMAKGEEIGAEVNLNINTTLEDINISSLNLSRILGNLLDNALYALEEVEEHNRKLAIDIVEDEEGFTFTILNNLPIIPSEIQTEIFKAGYTTKGDNGSGLGLYNVKTIVDKFHGSIKLVSREDTGTVFIVNFRK